ncbi:Calmodulin-binding [Novymonas esmeraldas]|uniref:Calmodulin-binding n=1 Tax=Novymonas esmeraldas TaxID=1808958 RepID=A0AAW0EL57_9TRYP
MPQNAAQLNRLQIREQEALNRQRRAQDDVAVRREVDAVRRTQAQYDHVRSHGYGRADGGDGGAGAAGEVEIRVYVRECEDGASQSFVYRESATSGTAVGVQYGSSSPPTAAAAAATARSQRGGGGNLPPISAPERAGASTRVPGGAETSAGAAVAPNRARVPRYLQQRKAELAAEKAAVAAEAERQRQLSSIPAGQRRVSEEEKADTLRQLDARQQELESQLARIPIRFDTQSIQQRRRAIEDELQQIEATRHKYSTRAPLFVPLT